LKQKEYKTNIIQKKNNENSELDLESNVHYRKNKELFFKILKNTYEAVHNIRTRHCLAYLHP